MALAENVRYVIPVYRVYIYNFAQADRPHAIRLPHGRGRAFAPDHRAEAGQDHDRPDRGRETGSSLVSSLCVKAPHV